VLCIEDASKGSTKEEERPREIKLFFQNLFFLPKLIFLLCSIEFGPLTLFFQNSDNFFFFSSEIGFLLMFPLDHKRK
jgi:hypothetical protein